MHNCVRWTSNEVDQSECPSEEHHYERISFMYDDSTVAPNSAVQVPKRSAFKFAMQILIVVLLLSAILCVILLCFKLSKTSQENRNGTMLYNIDQLNQTQLIITRVPKKDQLQISNHDIRQIVKDMTLEAWNAYKNYAWGHDSLSPLTQSAHNDLFGANSGRTLISSMSTLWVMELRDEFEQGKKWITESFVLKKIDSDMNVCDLVADFIGGLLSCYALMGDEMFLEKGNEIAKIIEPAYDTPTGLSLEQINPLKNTASTPITWLTWTAGQLLEYNYLADLTNDAKINSRVAKMRKTLKTTNKPHNLYMEQINVINGEWSYLISSLSWASRQFYIGLGKSYLQTNGRDVEALQMYKDAFDAVEQNLLIQTSKNGSVYVRTWGEDKHFMKYHSCYLGALLSLGSNAMKIELEKNKYSFNSTEKRKQLSRITRHTKLAEDLTETCHEASVRTKTGLAPYVFNFNVLEEAQNLGNDDGLYQKGHMLNPELAESYFTLWRRTHKLKYRTYAWQMIQAIHEHCRTKNGGYFQLSNVDSFIPKRIDDQPPYFIGGTLKYLYLIFQDDDDLLPLDQWIFNTVGQPLPIRGNYSLYPN